LRIPTSNVKKHVLRYLITLMVGAFTSEIYSSEDKSGDLAALSYFISLDYDGGRHWRDVDAQIPILMTKQISFGHLLHARRSAAGQLLLVSFLDSTGFGTTMAYPIVFCTPCPNSYPILCHGHLFSSLLLLELPPSNSRLIARLLGPSFGIFLDLYPAWS
jgi:hypothetical protein